jgi:hypothetical protein
MKTLMAEFLLVFFLSAAGLLAGGPSNVVHPALPLDQAVGQFDIQNAILRDGIAELSSKSIDGLHLGFEEIIRNKIQDDPRTLSVHFSLHLKNKTVKEILNAICSADPRYTWSADGDSINILPQSTVADPNYLPNLRLHKVNLSKTQDPDQALPVLSQQYPDEQVGYMQAGGDISYAEPWSVSFENLTVRQFVNRLAEHIGSQSSWIWQGGREERMFTFNRGGFQTRTHPRE